MLYLPVHVNSNHWIATYVNFSNGKIGYGQFELSLKSTKRLTVFSLGNSLAHKSSPHQKFLANLQLWLKIHFGIDAVDQGDSMTHGKQNDTFNCGPVSANTIAHHIFDDALWSPETAVYH